MHCQTQNVWGWVLLKRSKMTKPQSAVFMKPACWREKTLPECSSLYFPRHNKHWMWQTACGSLLRALLLLDFLMDHPCPNRWWPLGKRRDAPPVGQVPVRKEWPGSNTGDGVRGACLSALLYRRMLTVPLMLLKEFSVLLESFAYCTQVSTSLLMLRV